MGHRLVYATIFSVAQFNLQKNKTKKPFNPLLGETYEMIQEDYRFVAEQVSHHPPISAFYFQGNGFDGFGNTETK